jgi:hypothetical protein
MDPFEMLQLVFSREVAEMLEQHVQAQHPVERVTPESEFRSFLYLNIARLSALLHYHNRDSAVFQESKSRTQAPPVTSAGHKIIANREDYRLASELLQSLMQLSH